MARFSHNAENYEQAGGGAEEKIINLEKENFKFRLKMESLQKENTAVKSILRNFQNGNEVKKFESFLLEKDQDIARLRKDYTALCKKHDEYKEKFESLKEQQPQESLSSSLQDRRRIFELEGDLAKKGWELSDCKEKIIKLRGVLKSECSNLNETIRELAIMKKQLEQANTQLDQAQEIISEKERKINEHWVTIDNLMRGDDGREKEKTIKVLEGQVKELQEKHAFQQAQIAKQSEYIEELDEEYVERVGSALDAEESLNAKIIKLKIELRETTDKLEEMVNDNIENEAENDQLFKFVKELIMCTEFPKPDDQQTILNQLELLKVHIQGKMEILNKFCKLMEKNGENGNFSCPISSSTLLGSVATPPPSPAGRSASSSVSPRPPPPSQCQPNQESTIDVVDLTGDDNLYNELIFTATPTWASTSKVNQKGMAARRRIAKIIPSANYIKRHAENVAKRRVGQGPNNVGAKFYCTCKFVSDSQLMLEQHIKHAAHEGKFKCPVCLKRFYKFGTWRSHIKTNHSKPEDLGTEKYTCGCQTCGEMFQTIVLKRQHYCVLPVTDRNVVMKIDPMAPSENSMTVPTEALTTTPMEIDDGQDYADSEEASSPVSTLNSPIVEDIIYPGYHKPNATPIAVTIQHALISTPNYPREIRQKPFHAEALFKMQNSTQK